jgi:serine/threonine-protein kinase SRPK3
MFGRPLSSRRGAPDGLAADKNQLARMVALPGPHPQLLSNRAHVVLVFSNDDGSAAQRGGSE